MPNYAHRIVKSDNITLDTILPVKETINMPDKNDLAKHLFDGVEQSFYKKIKPGDFLVAGANFGCGRSKNWAPLALLAAGVGAIIAKSYSRLFYRTAVNEGLILVECETNYIDDMDELELSLEKSVLRNRTKCVDLPIKPVPYIARKFLQHGGVFAYLREKGGFGDAHL